MPVVVGPPPHANAGWLTLDIEEQQILQGYDADVFPAHQRLLLVSLGHARWIVATPTGDVYAEDLADEDVTPLVRASPFPAAGRPIFAFGPTDGAEMARLRTAASALALVLGVTVAAPAVAAAGASWFYSDTALELFGQEVPAADIGAAATLQAGDVAIVFALVKGARQATTAQHILKTDLDLWKTEKREGGGRDPRILPVDRAAVVLPTFRDSIRAMSAPRVLERFKGPWCGPDLARAVASSGLEPVPYCVQWEAATGLNSRSGLALEHRLAFYGFWSFVVLDGLDPSQSATMEHYARRVLQIQAAVRKNHETPDFDGLSGYMDHMYEAGTSLRAPGFDAHIANLLKEENFVLKQTRLAREEQQQFDKRKNKEKDDP